MCGVLNLLLCVTTKISKLFFFEPAFTFVGRILEGKGHF